MEAIALFDFEPEREDELKFRKGAHLIVLMDNVEKNWSKASLCQKVGLVPKNFIRFKVIPGCLRFTTREQAIKLLSEHPLNHSYLIRGSQKGENTFSISVKHDKEIRHFKILTDDENKFFILDKKFPSINELIEHHKVYSLNRTEKIVLANPLPMIVKSRLRFGGPDQSELSFEKEVQIEVTDYVDKNWWFGTYEHKTGVFPVPYIVPVDFPLYTPPALTATSSK
ncbi:PREDICTED: protein enhancer of sevenless 2B-like [Amphimedon queenslandica]|uniref:SH2 domain-containing protein n=1 Tax=Amphimedon queenslandica TaxID=400682 RepID=A0A1X7UK05_AMPQE|nr:PREDICTED: protein enhancer of sevenless 2B-like [Amphimedon queenslandica]|eukprot:XP_011404762.1 PREDICTED: protein enhancer of sevenless 2B-like [Amphimedon queenslandica]